MLLGSPLVLTQTLPEQGPLKLYPHYFAQDKYETSDYYLGTEQKAPSAESAKDKEDKNFDFVQLLQLAPQAEAFHLNRMKLQRGMRLQMASYRLQKYLPTPEDVQFFAWIGR